MVILLYLYLSEIFLKTDEINYKCITYIIVICLADYIFRKYITNAILFFSLRLLFIPAIPLATFNVTEILLLSIIFFAFYWMGITFWKSDGSDKHLFAIDMVIEGIVLFIGIYFHASYNMSDGLENYAYLSGIVYILCHFLRLYLDRFILISMNRKDNASALNRSFRMNSSFIFIFILCFILFILGINLILDNKNFNFIGTFLKYILSIFFGFFSLFKGEDAIQELESVTTAIQETGNSTTTKPSNPEELPVDMSSNPIGDTIYNVLQVVVYVGIVIAILYVLYKFFKSYMYRNRETDDIIETVETNDRTDAKITSDKKVFKLFLDNREKVRKIYKNTITNRLKHNRRIKIRRSNTPIEIHSAIVKDTDCSPSDLKILTDVYEKARYSNQDITTEDVEFIKSLNN